MMPRSRITYSARCPQCEADATWTASLFSLPGPTGSIEYEIKCPTTGCEDDPSWPRRHADE